MLYASVSSKLLGLGLLLLFSSRVGTLCAAERAKMPVEVERYGELYCQAVSATDTTFIDSVIHTVYSTSALQNIGATRLLAQIDRVRQTFGGLEYHHAELREVQTGNRISRVLHVHAQSQARNSWHDLQFRLEPDPPHKLNELAFIAEASAPVALPESSVLDAGVLSWLQDYVGKLERQEEMSGALLIARGDSILIERYLGSANEHGTPVTPKTKFSLASGGKMFTATAVAQLVEQGKLSFETKIAELLPALPDTGRWREINVGHLLSHTSGIAEYWTEEYLAVRDSLKENSDHLPLILRGGMNFDPGTQFEYSNSNFILAGMLIEAVSGERYFDYLERLLFTKLGMANSGRMDAPD